MRAHILRPVIPALAILAAACSPPSDKSASSSSIPKAAPSAASAPATPAPTQVAAAPADDALKAAQDAVGLRQAPMKLMGWNFGALRGIMSGNAPFDAALVKTNTSRIAAIAPMIPGVFVTDVRGAAVKTRARDAVWTNKADFDAKAKGLLDAATAASTAAATGDEAATKAALGGLGKACSSCHDDFRETAS
jgi:cytochrome c556